MSAASGASDVVTAFMQAMERRDLEAAGAFVTDDLVYHNIPMQPIHGRDAMVAALAPFLAGSLTVEWVVHHQTATGNVVMNERLDRFQLKADKWLEIPVAGVFVLRDGKIAEWRDYFDLADFQRQAS